MPCSCWNEVPVFLLVDSWYCYQFLEAIPIPLFLFCPQCQQWLFKYHSHFEYLLPLLLSSLTDTSVFFCFWEPICLHWAHVDYPGWSPYLWCKTLIPAAKHLYHENITYTGLTQRGNDHGGPNPAYHTSLSNCLDTYRENQLFKYVWFYFWTLFCPMDLYVYSRPISHCLTYCGFYIKFLYSVI